MSATHLGFYNTATTRHHVRFQFSTHEAAGGNVAPSSAFEAADLRIYRAADGAAFSATQRSSANGITMTSPFDSLAGFHDVDIDLSDNTDSGFYASGYLYSVVLSPDETVDSATITGKVLHYFEIGPQPVNVTHFGGTAGTFSSGRPEVNTTHWKGTAAATVDTAGYPVVTVKDGTGAGEIALTGGAIDTVTTVTTTTNLTNAPTNGDLTATMKTSVETAVANQVVVYKLDHLVHTADSDDVADNSIIAKLASKGATADWSSYVNTTDSLEALRDRGDAAWITATSVTVSDKTGFSLSSTGLDLVTAWTVAITGNITGNLSGSVGSVTGAVGSVTGNVGGNVTGSIGSLATQAKADVNGEVDTAISDAALATAANLAIVAADLPTRITKNTALAGFPFLMVDATDLSTAETGLTVTATRSLDGASFASCTNSVSEIGNGWYKIDLAAGDLNGNTVALRFTASGAATRNITLITQPT